MHQPIQPKSLSRWKNVDNSLILQHSPLLVGSLLLGFELKTSDFDIILNYMHQPIQLKSLRYVWFGFQPAVAFTKSQKPTKSSGYGRKPPPKAAFSLFKIKKNRSLRCSRSLWLYEVWRNYPLPLVILLLIHFFLPIPLMVFFLSTLPKYKSLFLFSEGHAVDFIVLSKIGDVLFTQNSLWFC